MNPILNDKNLFIDGVQVNISEGCAGADNLFFVISTITIYMLIFKLNHKNNIGLVVGATVPQELSRVRDLAPDLPILIPGVGAQGGDLEKSVYEGNKSGIGIINVSRDISFSGDCSVKSIRSSAKSYVKKINEAMNG